MKIYEKDGAVWAEHDGWTVCATDEAENNTLARKHGEEVWVAITDPDGKLVGCDFAIKDLQDLLNHAGFPHIEYFTTYHQTLRGLMEKPYGHAGEWEKDTGGFKTFCVCCKKQMFQGQLCMERKRENGKREHLCGSCFDRYVAPAPAAASTESLVELKSQHRSNVKVKGPRPSAKDVYTPEKRPIDPAEVDETWVGATVERKEKNTSMFTGGKHYEVFGVSRPHFVIIDDLGKVTDTHCSYFTLVKKADELPPNRQEDDTPKTRTEYTYSATLQFPDNTVVEIPPPPESEGWKAKTLWDESEWPHRYASSRSDLYPIGYQPDMDSHKNGFLIWKEYKARIITERPRVVSLTEWTRELVAVPIEVTFDLGLDDTRKKRVNSTWPQRHPPGAVKEREE